MRLAVNTNDTVRGRERGQPPNPIRGKGPHVPIRRRGPGECQRTVRLIILIMRDFEEGHQSPVRGVRFAEEPRRCREKSGERKNALVLQPPVR
jgi:hypothetical protein